MLILYVLVCVLSSLLCVLQVADTHWSIIADGGYITTEARCGRR